MIGIVVALLNEAKDVIFKTNAKESRAKNGKTLFSGKIGEENFIMILSGIGKVNAALSAQFLIDNFPLDYIVNLGSCGGLAEKTKVLEYYSVDKCCQYDFDLSGLDNVPVGYIQDYDTVYFYPKKDKFSFLPTNGLASSDRFTEKDADIKTVSELNCALFDMEGGAIAQVCTANGIPYYIFKGVTDTHASGADENTFYRNLNTVCEGFYDILFKAVKDA